MLLHPEIYFKDCVECKTYIMSDGEAVRDSKGNKIKRIEGEKPNCKTCEKSSATILNKRNELTWQMYLRHKHLGLEDFERKDSLVQRHIIMLGEIDKLAEMTRQAKHLRGFQWLM